MKKYIAGSYQKFKSDILSKFLYDALKFFLGIIFALFFFKYVPTLDSIKSFLNNEISISYFTLILSHVILSSLIIIFINSLFKKKIKRFEENSLIDDMTGLLNRKALLKEFESNVNSQNFFSLIIIDIDDFKNFNTNHSYLYGDKIISKVGNLLARDSRITDSTYRQYNKADEFIVIANKTNLENAFYAAERKRKNIEDTIFDIDNSKTKLTVSCAVTEFQKGDTFESMIQRLSKGLAEAKTKEKKNNSIKIQ